MKKIMAVFVVMFSLFILAGCGEKEAIKIGIMQANATEGQQKYISDYLTNVIAENYNVEFVFSETLSNAEADVAFLEGLASAGAKGVIAFVNNQTEDALANKLVELKLYYTFFGNPNAAQLAAHLNNPYYLGGIGQQNSEVSGMYNLTKSLLSGKSGEVTMLLASGGDSFGIQMFVDRVAGVMQAVAEYEAKASGNKVVIDKLVGFPSIPNYVSNAAAKLAEKPDIVIATMSGELFLGQINQISNYEPLFGVNGSIAPALLNGVTSGKIDYLAAINPQIVAMTFAILFNVVSGDKDFVPANQLPVRIAIDYTAVKTPADILALTENDLFTIEEINSVITSKTRNATFQDLLDLINEKY